MSRRKKHRTAQPFDSTEQINAVAQLAAGVFPNASFVYVLVHFDAGDGTQRAQAHSAANIDEASVIIIDAVEHMMETAPTSVTGPSPAGTQEPPS